jgi:hypothetical protein
VTVAQGEGDFTLGPAPLKVGEAERSEAERAEVEIERRGTPETLAGVGVPQEVTNGAGASRVTCAAYQRHVQMGKNQLGALRMQIDRTKRVGGSGSAPFSASLLLVIWPYQGVGAAMFTPFAFRDASSRPDITEWRQSRFRPVAQKVGLKNGRRSRGKIVCESWGRVPSRSCGT